MCGIFALLNNNNIHKIFSSNIIKESFNKGVNRGPEYSELKTLKDNLLFGFHRLSINGLNAESNQPMTIDGITLICNGEIYNYKELFAYSAINPTTNSDCEIIIHLYKQYGIEYLLQLLDGVFAFVLYDANQEKIYVARDPYGVRPLYLLNDNTATIPLIAFASELKVLSVLLNDNGATDRLKITHVLPGTYISFSLTSEQEWRINNSSSWSSSSSSCSSYKRYHGYAFTPKLLLPKDETQDNSTNIYYQLCSHLINAVKKRVIGTCERPIACLLSGGLDSSLIAALVSKFYPGQLETYSIGMEGSEDLRYAAIVAKHIGSKHTSIIVSEEDFFNAIPEVIRAIESYDTTSVRASVGNYLIGKYISQHSQAKVIFNGDGSDELMGGYLYFHAAPNPLAFDKECKRLLSDIYAFDVLRSDKCISSHGLEPRTPFLDRGWVDYYLSLPISIRQPTAGNIEKKLLRSAFAKFEPGLLPDAILWRKKEAFSDGVSGTHKSWFQIIHERLEKMAETQEEEQQQGCSNKKNKEYEVNTPITKEQIYYRELFDEAYPNTADIVPYFWMPQFIEANDPSARTLKIYNNNTK